MDRFDVLIRALTGLAGLTGDDYQRRRVGLDWPTHAETMIGVERMTNVKDLALDVIARGVPGDFMECGIWRGGVGILMAKILEASPGPASEPRRRVLLADSFEGCPVPSMPEDAGDPHHTFDFLKVSPREVWNNLLKYGVDPDLVELVPGWFRDSLPGPVTQLALLRIDADMYESTSQVLDALYDLVNPGGYVIIDDFHNIRNCQAAVKDFWHRRALQVSPVSVDWCAIYWRKASIASNDVGQGPSPEMATGSAIAEQSESRKGIAVL